MFTTQAYYCHSAVSTNLEIFGCWSIESLRFCRNNHISSVSLISLLARAFHREKSCFKNPKWIFNSVKMTELNDWVKWVLLWHVDVTASITWTLHQNRFFLFFGRDEFASKRSLSRKSLYIFQIKVCMSMRTSSSVWGSFADGIGCSREIVLNVCWSENIQYL